MFPDKIEIKCAFWDRLHPIFRDSPKMATPYAADSMDPTDDAEHFLMKNAREEYDLSIEVDHASMNSQAASIPQQTIVPHVMTAELEPIGLKKKKKITSLSSPSTSDDDSKHDEPVSEPKKATLSGTKKARKKLASYDDMMESYDRKKLDLEAEKNEIARRKVSSMEKSAEYQHQERMEALSVQRLEAETRRAEAQSNHSLLQLQLENLKRQYEK